MQELSLNILDIAQNSVKAGARLVRIAVCEDTVADRMEITVEDDGCGMDEETVLRVTDPFYTTRTTRRVGLGVPFFKMAAEMTGGGLEIRSAPGAGTAVRARFGLKHIDRAPLGDMAGTMCALIGCNPELDFVYEHGRDGRAYDADTRAFREALGEEIPLSAPEVLAFIRGYIIEHEEDLDAGSAGGV